jgi:hypothetical protein
LKGDINRRVETNTTPGQDGTKSTDLGYGGCQVTVTLQLWTQAHLDAYIKIANYIRPKAGGKPDALDVLHPSLAAVGIRSLIVFRLGLPEKAQAPGVYEVQVELEEFVPEKKGTTKVVTTSTSVPVDPSTALAGLDTAQDTPPSASMPPPTGKK